MRIEDVKALVTGGSAGIGFEVARALIERGAKVAISGRDEVRLKQAASTLGATADSGRCERRGRRGAHGQPHHRGLRRLQRAGEQRRNRCVRAAARDHGRGHAPGVGGQRPRRHHRGARVGAALRAEEVRRHHQHLVHVGPARRRRQQRLCLDQVRAPRAQRGVAGRAQDPQHPGHAAQPERGHHRVRPAGRACAAGQPVEASRRRHRPRGGGNAGDGGSRVHPGAERLGHEPPRQPTAPSPSPWLPPGVRPPRRRAGMRCST